MASEEKLRPGDLESIEVQVDSSWAVLPEPPEGMSRFDVVMRLLESPADAVNVYV